MPFKSDNFRKFLYAMDKDKQKGINPMEAKTSPKPIKVQTLGDMKVPSLSNPKLLNPTAAPSLAALPKAPKFGRIKKYFKKPTF